VPSIWHPRDRYATNWFAMLTDKQQKKEFKKVASADPDKYYRPRS